MVPPVMTHTEAAALYPKDAEIGRYRGLTYFTLNWRGDGLYMFQNKSAAFCCVLEDCQEYYDHFTTANANSYICYEAYGSKCWRTPLYAACYLYEECARLRNLSRHNGKSSEEYITKLALKRISHLLSLGANPNKMLELSCKPLRLSQYAMWPWTDQDPVGCIGWKPYVGRTCMVKWGNLLFSHGLQYKRSYGIDYRQELATLYIQYHWKKLWKRRNDAARRIQQGCYRWLWNPTTSDGKLGIQMRCCYEPQQQMGYWLTHNTKAVLQASSYKSSKINQVVKW